MIPISYVLCVSLGCKPRASGDDPMADTRIIQPTSKPRASGDDPLLNSIPEIKHA